MSDQLRLSYMPTRLRIMKCVRRLFMARLGSTQTCCVHERPEGPVRAHLVAFQIRIVVPFLPRVL